jgi:GNAT superfamily N-acetyltransferase
VKGQKLFVRLIEADDAAALQEFASLHDGDPSPSAGLIGKLVGELVAVLTMELEPNTIRITGLVVAKELRRKRIGRVMLNELANLAATMKREWLVAGLANRTFLERVGFREGGGVMRRRA